jgi:3-isopropylmalate/(R)-2-methylmalate dehydratase small subunit
MLGIPCFVASADDINKLQSAIERDPSVVLEASVDTGTVKAGPLTIKATLPPALRDAFLSGQWNPTAMLLDKFDDVRAVAKRLPYVSGF